MRHIKITLIAILALVLSCNKTESNTSSLDIEDLINSYQDHKGYDEKAYPWVFLPKNITNLKQILHN